MQNSTSSWGGTADTAALPDERNIEKVKLEVEAWGNYCKRLYLLLYLLYKKLQLCKLCICNV